MNLAKNLQYLRKRDKITQEELADKLGVSRQSISKWETGEAYPETDKLIILCDMFKVSLDSLMRGDITEEHAKEEPADNREFITLTDKFSKGIALGVFLILAGVAVCVALGGVAQTLTPPASDLTAVFGAVILLSFIAVAVFLFVLRGMEYDAFKKEHPQVNAVDDMENNKKFLKKFNTSMACLVAGIIADTVFLVIFSALIEADIIAAANKDCVYSFIVAAFMLVLAFIVGGLVYLGIQHGKYDVSEYNKQNKNDGSPRNRLRDGLCSAVMLLATAIYLFIGFVFNYWHPSWIVFPLGGLICAIINVIFGTKGE